PGVHPVSERRRRPPGRRRLSSTRVSLREALLELVPDSSRVSDGDSILEGHSADLTYHAARRPDAVVFPTGTDEVAAVLAYADRELIPVVPWGAGSSLEGHVIPLAGGIVLDL